MKTTKGKQHEVGGWIGIPGFVGVNYKFRKTTEEEKEKLEATQERLQIMSGAVPLSNNNGQYDSIISWFLLGGRTRVGGSIGHLLFYTAWTAGAAEPIYSYILVSKETSDAIMACFNTPRNSKERKKASKIIRNAVVTDMDGISKSQSQG